MQAKIGWEHLFRGYPATLWALLPPHPSHSTYCSASEQLAVNKRLSKHNNRIKSILREIFHFTHTLWKARCTILHSSELSILPILHAAIDLDIKAIYALKDSYPPHIQRWMRIPLATILKRSPRARSNWLQMARTILPRITKQPRKKPSKQPTSSRKKKPHHTDYPKLYAQGNHTSL